LDHVVAVLDVVGEGVELAFRGELAAHVVDDDDVALARGALRGHPGAPGLFTVLRAAEQHRVPAAVRGPVDVRAQHRPVASGERDVLLDHDGERLGHTIYSPRRRRLGSSASRSPSPSRLMPTTVTKMARPGSVAIHQAFDR